LAAAGLDLTLALGLELGDVEGEDAAETEGVGNGSGRASLDPLQALTNVSRTSTDAQDRSRRTCALKQVECAERG
jgi:hypothetical protein